MPFTSFREFNKDAGGNVWFAFDQSRPLAFFAGIWTNLVSVRKLKEGMTINDLFGFLTTEQTMLSAQFIRRRCRSFLRKRKKLRLGWRHLAEEASMLQRALEVGALKIVARGERKDEAT